MRYIQGESRDQGSLFPVSLDELVPDNHVVTVLESLRGAAVRFHPQHTIGNRPAYDPGDLLQLYLYG